MSGAESAAENRLYVQAQQYENVVWMGVEFGSVVVSWFCFC